MNTVEERLARYRYELDAAQVGDTVGEVRSTGAPGGGGRRVLVLAGVALLVLVGLVAVTRRGGDDNPASGGGGAPFAWTTSRVVFSANSFTIDVGSQQFTPSDVKVDVHTDPGDATYATLELSWQQHQVLMNVNIYFAADATNWWVSEMRTYNGKSGTDADWVTFTGDRFRTPIGGTYKGDVDLTATEGGVTSHLQMRGLSLALLPSSNAPTASSVLPTYATVPSVTAVGQVATTAPLPAARNTPEQWYTASKGETLAAIALQFSVSPKAVADFNGWTDGVGHLVTAGSTVRVPPGADLRPTAVVPYGSLMIDSEGNAVGVGATTSLTGVCLLTATEIAGCDSMEQPTPKVVVRTSPMSNPANTLIYGIADADLSIRVVDASGATVAQPVVTKAYQGREAFAVKVTTNAVLSIVAIDQNSHTTSYPVPH
jgi:hypothetical protein